MASVAESISDKEESCGEKADLHGDKIVGPVGDLLTELSQVQVGLKLEAKDAYGKWYIARVLEIEDDDDEVLVHFERWNSRYDEYIKISSERLRILLPERMEALEKEREKAKKSLNVGDLVQAKWEDGRMYFGKVLKLYQDEVDVLFDDGVKYKAPISRVRKRNHTSRSHLSRSSLQESDSSQTPNPRDLRAEKRKRNRSEDSASQASYSSPPSSPVFVPSKRHRMDVLDSDTDSDFEDTRLFKSRTLGLNEPTTNEDQKRELRRKVSKWTISASSDSDVSIEQAPTRKRKRLSEKSREAYKLRHSTHQLSPVKEHSAPLSEGQPPTKVAHPSSQKASTPVGSTKGDASGDSEKAGGAVSKKDPAVASRTRAQTKFENVSRKSDLKKPVKVAPKEMVIVWDHNEFKCTVTGCNKSFRKDSLLQSHLKHYHSTYKPVPKQRATPGQVTKEKSHDKGIKKESSVSPSVSKKVKGHSHTPPPMLSPQMPTQQASKPAKTSPKTSPKKKDTPRHHSESHSEATVSQRTEGDSEHPSAMLDTTPVSHCESKTPKSAKKSGLSVAGPPLRVPMVEIKSLPREQLSPKKRTKSNSFSKDDDFGEGVRAKAGQDDVVHCMCGDHTDEGFMIQCEECLCWQHGDCVKLTKSTLPKKYVCYYCTNPPGLRNRLKHQFDKEWFGNGTLPSLSGSLKFPHGLTVKHTHQITDSLYKLKKMLHSSKVKLHAAGRVNHPYLRQWAKECTHLEKDDIIPYLTASLIPISYLLEDKETVERPHQSNGASESTLEDVRNQTSDNRLHNGSAVDKYTSNRVQKSGVPFNVASLRLDPLPHSVPAVHQTSSNGADSACTDETNSPDPKTLKLAPLPPLKTESLQQLTTEILKQSIHLSVGARSSLPDGSLSSTGSKEPKNQEGGAAKTETHEVINDEFGVQELSVFALNNDDKSAVASHAATTATSLSSPLTATTAMFTQCPMVASPSKLISSSRSAFTPVVAPSGVSVTTLYPSTTPLTPQIAPLNSQPNPLNSRPPQTVNPKSVAEQSASKLTSTMDSVTLGEFADAFMQGDTTNWYQRMRLLDHIESVQEKVSSWMDSLEEQLDELPDEDTEGVEELLECVQSTMSQLRQIQTAI